MKFKIVVDNDGRNDQQVVGAHFANSKHEAMDFVRRMKARGIINGTFHVTSNN